MSGLYSIILAGGQGSRLWPLSREMSPKQMFKINNEFSLFQQTFLKLAGIVDDKNIITTTNVKYVSDVKEQLNVLKEKFSRKRPYQVLSEPISRNTAPAIALGTKYISDKYSQFSQPVIIAAPSDQIIYNREDFVNIIEKGVKLAQNGYIVSFVTETKEINENFGYVKLRKVPKIYEIEPSALKVTEFTEKPSKKKQLEKLKGKFYINSGIYMFTPQTLFSELKKYSPEIYKIIINEKIEDSIPSVSLSTYQNMPDISIDYAIMEKTNKLAAIILDTKWKDIGSWDTIYELLNKDKSGNVTEGNVIKSECTNSMIYSTSKLIAAMGLNDTFVVETQDAVLVCERNNLNGIQKIYKKLNNKNTKTKEIHKTVYRPWGYYTVLEDGDGFLTKCITVNPESKLSLQLHHHRSEHWVVLEGEATIIKGEETYKLNPGESINIDIEEIHSLQNLSKEQLKIIEIQQGEILDENDIERLEDIYGRV